MTTIRTWQIVQCERCGHTWDDDDPKGKPCPCFDQLGYRIVILLSAGTSNIPLQFPTR